MFGHQNWIERITVYESDNHVYLFGSDSRGCRHRIMKIARHPLPSTFDREELDATVEAETPEDRLWTLDIHLDPHTYTTSELRRLLVTIEAANQRTANVSESRRAWAEGYPSRKPSSVSLASGTESEPAEPEPLMISATSSVPPFSSTSMSMKMRVYAVLGFVRFLRGYYIILVTKRQVVAQIGEHLIYKVEDTCMIYIPGANPSITRASLSPYMPPVYISLDNSSRIKAENRVYSSKFSNLVTNFFAIPTIGPSAGVIPEQMTANQAHTSSSSDNTLLVDETRYMKLFQSVDLSSNFYYSHTYDLTHSLQINLAPVVYGSEGGVTARAVDDRFVWNWHFIPPRFRENLYAAGGDKGNKSAPAWMVPMVHGFVRQSSISQCGMPLCLTLVARRSRLFAGARFLKRGINMTGEVANEVETEQIVHKTSESRLVTCQCSSYTQIRGSVPIFWTQEPTKMVLSKPPIEIMVHERLTVNELITADVQSHRMSSLPGLVYLFFDMARVHKSHFLNAIDRLRPIGDWSLNQTGLFFSPGRIPCSVTSKNHAKDYFERAKSYLRKQISPIQCGVVRVNCVDCLDRTNTGQFVVGQAALAHQLAALKFISSPEEYRVLGSGTSAPGCPPLLATIDRLLQDLYEEMGDTIALQYGGSQLVHNIETYRKNGKFSSHSRDFVQTLSRYYSNKFSDYEKQMALNLFLGVYRPGAWKTNLSELLRHPTFVADIRQLCESNDWDFVQRKNRAMSQVITVCAASCDSSYLWDLPTDAHLHWLSSWVRLPLYRSPLTNWCSEAVCKSLPLALQLKKRLKSIEADKEEEDRCATPVAPSQLIRSGSEMSWFEQVYPPHEYTRLDKLPIYANTWLKIDPQIPFSNPVDSSCQPQPVRERPSKGSTVSSIPTPTKGPLGDSKFDLNKAGICDYDQNEMYHSCTVEANSSDRFVSHFLEWRLKSVSKYFYAFLTVQYRVSKV
ncbi:phosphatidylinositol-3,5-bisphosphate 5-phosphatase [Cichlidogyrus casuarinus]|uniref:Phosphatidylinositol-3,5-bisphosphate 5-phosphatase n=1 Tax=Cichlidogyrus casuarinus TaxID=1844966 RepID=A0ABD2QLF7_9PLAT